MTTNRSTDGQVPPWVVTTILVAGSGAVVLVIAMLLDNPLLGLGGAVALVGGIVVASVAVAVYARKAGTRFWSAAWRGFRAAAQLFWNLAP